MAVPSRPAPVSGALPKGAGGAPAFEVLDVLEGLFTLARRTPTLDGSVPLRVAQGCVPHLAGNAFGVQLVLTRPLAVRRSLGGLSASFEEGAALDALHRSAVRTLEVRGLLPAGGAWARALGGSPAICRGGAVRLFTGLLVRPATGLWLRASGAANRRNVLVDVDEQLFRDDGGFVPLVLTLRPVAGFESPLRLAGELGCLAPLRPGVAVRERPLGEARELLEAHAAFYDGAYFEAKKEGITGKYRRLVAGEAAVPAEVPPAGALDLLLARAGPVDLDVVPLDRFTTVHGPEPREVPEERRRLDSVVFRNAVPFRASFDGHTLVLDADRKVLLAKGREVERALAPLGPERLAGGHRGWLWYLTKYFTPHPPGEPHFFVKPWAFVRTPAGWSLLLEGVHGPGYDVLRGVVSTDVFPALPAVFRLNGTGVPIRVPEGRPLLTVVPVPRDLLEPAFTAARLE